MMTSVTVLAAYSPTNCSDAEATGPGVPVTSMRVEAAFVSGNVPSCHTSGFATVGAISLYTPALMCTSNGVNARSEGSIQLASAVSARMRVPNRTPTLPSSSRVTLSITFEKREARFKSLSMTFHPPPNSRMVALSSGSRPRLTGRLNAVVM